MSNKRIYLVTPVAGGEQMLVNASNRAAARNAATRAAFNVDLASQADLVRLITAGVKVMDDSAEEQADAQA